VLVVRSVSGVPGVLLPVLGEAWLCGGADPVAVMVLVIIHVMLNGLGGFLLLTLLTAEGSPHYTWVSRSIEAELRLVTPHQSRVPFAMKPTAESPRVSNPRRQI
jgi:hypothetical protein